EEALEQRGLAVRAKAEAEKARKAEESARQGEAEQRARAEGLLYAMSIERAQSAWRENDVGRADQILMACKPEQPAWEWRYLHRPCQADPRTLQGHTGAVLSVCFSPDGTRLASAGISREGNTLKGEVKVWDAERGTEVLTLKGHTGPV